MMNLERMNRRRFDGWTRRCRFEAGLPLMLSPMKRITINMRTSFMHCGQLLHLLPVLRHYL